MKVSDKLDDMYSGYYAGNSVNIKRQIAASQTLDHINTMLTAQPYENLIDIGAGEGSLLVELDRKKFAKSLYAVEISESGVNAIRHKKLDMLITVEVFDGYKIAEVDDKYEIGSAVHVLEHVEHEREFLKEITRVCKTVYIEVPLELTARVERSIMLGRPYGHINFYNAASFRNLLETSNLEVINFKVFSNSLEYEVYLAGRVKGTIKYYVRSMILKLFPGLANLMFTYLAGAVCRKKID
jgi:ubiquinone/menaquinone biosynthesis C-methylase UbiE